MKKIGAIITGGDFQGLGALRSLAKHNIPIYLTDNDHCIARFSRYKKKFVKSPKPVDKELYFEFLIQLAKKEDLYGWVILPNNDEIVFVLSKYKDQLVNYYRIPTPEWDTTKYVFNKKLTCQLAEKIDIPIPKTYFPKSLDELIELELEFPVVIKPAIRDLHYRKTKVKAYLINNKDELISIYRKVCSIIDSLDILIQDYIPGGPKNLFSFCPLFKDGRALAHITARRTRQHPMDFGHASTFAESIKIPELEIMGSKFLTTINYYGLAEVEFMLDTRDGKFKLLEINPRLWGWHTLSIAAGIDLPYLLYLDTIGEKIKIQDFSENVKWLRLITDIPTVISEIATNGMRIKDYLTTLKGKKTFAVFSPNDPLPFFIEIAMLPYLWQKRGF